MCSECRANKSKSLSRAARSCIRRNTCCQSSRTCELVLQFNATEQLSICSHDDGRRAHRNGSSAHREIKPPVHEKTAGNRYFNVEWPDRAIYHAMINNTIGHEATVQIILNFMETYATKATSDEH